MRTNLSSQFDAATIKATKARIIARNTFKREENGETVIRLHGTDIVRKRADDSFVLNSGGWKTVTTKDRMNNALPGVWQIRQCNGAWTIAGVPYFDGMIIPRDLETPKAKGAQVAAREEKLRKQIRKFVCQVPLKGPFPTPDSGDCWYCLMQTQNGESLGDATGNNDHTLSHIKEGYLHGSLIVNALTWAGYKHPQLIYQMQLGANIRRALKRYLYRKCGLVS